MNDGEAKKAILARRARFLAAAMLSAGMSARCDEDPPPEPCLSIAQTAEPGPSVCLSTVPTACLTNPMPTQPPDAGTTIDAGAGNAGARDAGGPIPVPCLSPRRPPPQACLS